MAKRFFNERVHNSKRTIVNIVIIGVCVIGVIVCFIVTSNFQGENNNPKEGSLSLKEEAMVEVNEKYSVEIFFSKIDNVDLNKIKVTYPDNFDISKPGSYKVNLNINDSNYSSTLVVVDTKKPTLVVKEHTITEGNGYSVQDFVQVCSDNSKKDCKLEFYTDDVDDNNNKVDYSKYTNAGIYPIKVSASDESGNQTVLETKLTINKKDETPLPPVTTTCKYGNNEYDSNTYLLAVDVTTNKCAVSLDLYDDANNTKDVNKMMEAETTRLRKDVEKLKISGTLALNRKVIAVTNKDGSGIVGYEIRMTSTLSNNGKSEVIADYKLDKNGKRVFINNPKNLSE